MRILFNLSVIRGGGGIQVALSVLEEWGKNSGHQYYVLISPNLSNLIQPENYPDNFIFKTIKIAALPSLENFKTKTIIRDIERTFNPDVVFSLFGPSYWRPKVNHLCGYALPHFVYTESPFFDLLSWKERIIWKITGRIKFASLKKHSDYWVTESHEVSQRLAAKLKVLQKKVFTVNNVYNSIYNYPDKWKDSFKELIDQVDGLKLITITKFHLHKNLMAIPKVINYLEKYYPDFKFTFILTVKEQDFKTPLSKAQKKHILFLGKVAIEECPPLYQMSDALFMPTLLECFTVSYLEAMKMQKPILTSDLPFARDICQDAAEYFQPLDPKDVGEKIVKIAKNKERQQELIEKGTHRLQDFGTAEDRAKSYLTILEQIVKNNKKCK